MQRRRNSRPSRQCRGCPFWASPARCLNPSIRSGWCGDWIWYMRGSKQCRRRYARPKDPRTVAQLLNRGRFRTASKRYSRVLTDEQRHACIAAGAKVRSRPRLDQSGPLTGQQYWMRKDARRANTDVKTKSLKTIPQVLQPQRVARSTSGLHRSITGVSPEQRRLYTRAARPGGGGRKRVLQYRRVTGRGQGQCRRTAGVRLVRAGRHPGGSSLLRGLRARRRSWGVRTSYLKVRARRQPRLAWRRRSQPEQAGVSQATAQ